MFVLVTRYICTKCVFVCSRGTQLQLDKVCLCVLVAHNCNCTMQTCVFIGLATSPGTVDESPESFPFSLFFPCFTFSPFSLFFPFFSFFLSISLSFLLTLIFILLSSTFCRLHSHFHLFFPYSGLEVCKSICKDQHI